MQAVDDCRAAWHNRKTVRAWEFDDRLRSLTLPARIRKCSLFIIMGLAKGPWALLTIRFRKVTGRIGAVPLTTVEVSHELVVAMLPDSTSAR
jgi:hypothetical protein